jgi:hypothetical protein
MTKVKIVLDDLTDAEAYALAEMCKRMIWNHFDRLSANASERDAMDSATIKLRRALPEAGIEVR